MTVNKKLIKQYGIFFIGLYVSAIGVGLITKAQLGTSPISSIPYVLSLGFRPTLGQFTIVFNLLLIALQIKLGSGRIEKQHVGQIPITMLFGYLIDLTMGFLRGFNPAHYGMAIGTLLLGCVILGIGVYLEVIAGVIMLPGESFVKTVSEKVKLEFGTTKIICDASMAVIAILLSLLIFKKVNGVREGTLIAAFLVGLIAKTIQRWLHSENIA